jgi:hypothetical protein
MRNRVKTPLAETTPVEQAGVENGSDIASTLTAEALSGELTELRSAVSQIIETLVRASQGIVDATGEQGGVGVPDIPEEDIRILMNMATKLMEGHS